MTSSRKLHNGNQASVIAKLSSAAYMRELPLPHKQFYNPILNLPRFDNTCLLSSNVASSTSGKI